MKLERNIRVCTARLLKLVLPPLTWSAFLRLPLPATPSPGEQLALRVDLLFGRPSAAEVVGKAPESESL